MASKLPEIPLSTQADPYWEIPLYDSNYQPLSVEGRVFEAWVAPAVVGQGVGQPVAPIKVLTFGDGLTLVPPKDESGSTVKNTLVHRMTKEFAQEKLPRGELTADILEVVGDSRRLFIPVRLRYQDPAAIRDFVPDAVGVTFGGGRQPIITPVAIAGREGARGSGFLTGQGAPTSADGDNGDYWIDAAADPLMLYGPKENGVWPSEGTPITSSVSAGLIAARDQAVAAAEQAAAIIDLLTPPSLDFSRPAMTGAAQIVLLGA